MRDTTKISDRPAETEPRVTRLIELNRTSAQVSVEFKVVTKPKPRMVVSRTKSSRMLVTETVIADSTARMLLILWNEDAVEIEPGQVYRLTKGYVTTQDESMRLNRARDGELVRLHEREIHAVDSPDMSTPFLGLRKRAGGSESGRTFEGTAGRETKGYCSSKGF